MIDTVIGLLPVILFTGVALFVAHLLVSARAVMTAWRRRFATAAMLTPALPVAAWFIGVPLPWWLPWACTVLGLTMIWRRFLRNGDVISRWGEASRRKSGVASTRDVWRAASWYTLRRKARALRPTLTRGLGRIERARISLAELGAPIARAGLLRVWSAIEDVVLVFGGPRTGKTGWLGGRVIDAPGACLVTSTRTDLHDITATVRAQHGPVLVFNAAGVGGRPSTVTFDPLMGCTDPVTAVERATDLLAASSGDDDGDRAYWNSQARRVLAALMHAACLGQLTMSDVAGWVADPTGSERQVMKLLRSSPVPAYATDVAQFISTNDRTRSSITSTMMPAFGWLTSPSARAAAEPGASLDVERVLADHSTIYLLGAKDSHSAPLVAALTGYIAREARRIAAYQPGGRLDPPLTLVLDEAALLAPPLEDWTADMGGRNVTIYAAFQSRAQLLARWSQAQAAEILNNAATIMLFGNINDKDDLEFWSARAGDRDEPVLVTDAHGAVKTRSTRKTPVISPAQLANLNDQRVVVFRRGMPPVVGRARMVWDRRDLRAAQGEVPLWARAWHRTRPSKPSPAHLHVVPDLPVEPVDPAA